MNSILIETSTYKLGETAFDLYIAQPESISSPLPAILVAHAWDGLNAPIEEITRQVAQLGYVAVAIDIYGQNIRGDLTGDNSRLINPLLKNRNLLRNRLLAGYSTIRAIKTVDATRVGAIGYCFGGLCVLELARAVPACLKGVVSFHGGLTKSDIEDTQPIEASILIEHGWDDPLAPPSDYLAFANEMDERKADWQAHIHGGAMHAFTFKGANMLGNGMQYHAAAAHRSWQSMTDFFNEIL